MCVGLALSRAARKTRKPFRGRCTLPLLAEMAELAEMVRLPWQSCVRLTHGREEEEREEEEREEEEREELPTSTNVAMSATVAIRARARPRGGRDGWQTWPLGWQRCVIERPPATAATRTRPPF